MQYRLNKRNIKQSLQNLHNFFREKEIHIPRHILLDAIAKVFFVKNYNTLEGVITKPSIIGHIADCKVYMVEIESTLDKKQLTSLMYDAFVQAQCSATLDMVLYENGIFHADIVFPQNSNNFLTAMLLLSDVLKKYQVKRFELLRMTVERENLLGFVE